MAPPGAEAGWGRPFRIAQPFSLDVLAPQIAFSGSGAAGVGFAVQDADSPADSVGYVVWRGQRGQLSRVRRVPSAQQVLGLGFEGGPVELLTGDSDSADACCSSAGVVRMNPGGHFTPTRTLFRGLAGATEGELIPVARGLMAAVATERGVWAAQSSGERFGRVHALTSADARPEAFSAASLSGGAIVAWTQRDRGNAVPGTIYAATGTGRAAPATRRPVASVPRNHRIDELALVGSAPGARSAAGGPTLAWIESWFDKRGAYHSRVDVADVARPKQVRSFTVDGQIAAGLSFAQDGRGDQLLAWKSCTRAGACTVREALRRAGGRFDGPRRLGAIEAAESPAATLSSTGEGLIGWIQQGHVLAAELRQSATRFARAQTVSSTNFAADLALDFGPGRTAMAAWSQGTLAPEVVGAMFRAG